MKSFELIEFLSSHPPPIGVNNVLALVGILTPADKQYAQFKDEHLTPFLYDRPSQILRDGAMCFCVL
jgi:hypothetical protein